MRGLTLTESNKVHEITQRLADLSSPVLRIQAILQFSQIVDMLALGDTSSERERELIAEIDELTGELCELKYPDDESQYTEDENDPRAIFE